MAGFGRDKKEHILQSLEKLNLDKKIRAQDLSVGNWVDLVKELN